MRLDGEDDEYHTVEKYPVKGFSYMADFVTPPWYLTGYDWLLACFQRSKRKTDKLLVIASCSLGYFRASSSKGVS